MDTSRVDGVKAPQHLPTQVMKPSEYLKYAAAAALIIFVITTSWKQMAATARAMEETITRVMDRTLNESVKKAQAGVAINRRPSTPIEQTQLQGPRRVDGVGG